MIPRVGARPAEPDRAGPRFAKALGLSPETSSRRDHPLDLLRHEALQMPEVLVMDPQLLQARNCLKQVAGGRSQMPGGPREYLGGLGDGPLADIVNPVAVRDE